MTVPSNMKNGYFFQIGISIVQKPGALIPCDTPLKLKAIATDEMSGVSCPSLGTTCPKLIVSTSNEVDVDINDRPSISIEDLTTTSVAEGGKEKLTFKYKLKNATSAAVDFNNGVVKTSLYYDTNNHGVVDAGDTKLTDHTTSALTLAKGATSTEQSFSFAVDQDKVCRLLLVLKNEDNVCLCGDVVAPLTAPEKITGLVDNLTVCESETKKVAYSATGASYDQYTWTGKTANDKLCSLRQVFLPSL